MKVQYRGKHIETKEWVYGGGVVVIDDHYVAIPQTNNVTHEGYEMLMCKVVPETLGRFTGKLDSKGVEVYSDDLIKSPSEEDYDYCLVEWNEKRACFEINGYGKSMYHNEGGGEEYSQHITCIDEHVYVFGGDEAIEVIGNIHDNPTQS